MTAAGLFRSTSSPFASFINDLSITIWYGFVSLGLIKSFTVPLPIMDLSAIMNTNEHGSKTDGPKDTQNTAVTRSPSPKKTNDGQTSQQDETTAGTSNVSNTIKGLLHLPKANHAEIEASTSNTQAVNSKPILPSFRRTHAAPPNPTIATASTSNIHTSPKSHPPPNLIINHRRTRTPSPQSTHQNLQTQRRIQLPSELAPPLRSLLSPPQPRHDSRERLRAPRAHGLRARPRSNGPARST